MKRILGACCVLAIVTSVAFGQDQARPRSGFGGFGGPGGTQLSTAILAIPAVQEELSLNDDQKKQIRELGEKLRQEFSSSFQGFRDLSREERQKKLEELRKKGEEAGKSAVQQLAKILDAKQLERFEQLRLQREGAASFARAEIAEKLSLSKDQSEKIQKLLSDAREAATSSLGNLRQASEDERRAAFTKAREAREKLTNDALAVLNADQKATWEKLQGKKFDFPQTGFGGRTGGNTTRRPGAKADN